MKYINKFAKLAALCMIAVLLVFPMTVKAAGGTFGISASTKTVDPNKTFTVSIGGKCAGRVNISVSNGSASESKVWVDDGYVSVTITAGSSGTVTVTATPTEGFSDLDAELYNPGSKSVSVTIKEPEPPKEEDKEDDKDDNQGGSNQGGSNQGGSNQGGSSSGGSSSGGSSNSGSSNNNKPQTKPEEKPKEEQPETPEVEEPEVQEPAEEPEVQEPAEEPEVQEPVVEEPKKDLSDATISDIEDQIFTGQEIKPEFSIVVDGKELVEGVDYKVEYENNIEAGIATLTIIGMGDYEGTTITKTFEIIDEEVSTGLENVGEKEEEGCFIHWAILMILSLAAFMTYVFRKNMKVYVIVLLAVATVSVVLCFLGACKLDWIFAVVGTILLEILDIIFIRKYDNGNA